MKRAAAFAAWRSVADSDGTADHYVLNVEDRPGTTLIPSLEITFRNYEE